jgi:ABC-type bacteriocin/lantibiotic exporter with double-glycine peptidase domain
MAKDEVDSLSTFINKVFNITSNFTVFLVTLLIFSFYDSLLGFMFLIWFIAFFLFYIKVYVKLEKQTEILTKLESECLEKMSNCFADIVNIKTFSREKDEKNFFRKETKNILKNNWSLVKTKRLLAIIDTVNMLIFFLLYSLEYIYYIKITE